MTWTLKLRVMAAATATLVAATGPSAATEFGQTHVDLDYIDTLAGYNLPAGFYVRDDINYNISKRLNDQNGNRVQLNGGRLGTVPLKFYQSNAANVFSLIYSSNYVVPFINARLGTAIYGFYAQSRAEAKFTLFGRTTGSGETRRGFGDLTVVPVFLQWQIPSANLSIILSPLEFTAPSGQYNEADPIGNNIGLNYWSYRPALELTYLNATGQEASANMNLSFNSQNNATKYKSGNEFSITYVLQQHFSPQFAAGLEGYYYRQFTDDTQNGTTVNTVRSPSPLVPFDPLNGGAGNRGEVFALGPTITWTPTPRINTNFHWAHEVFSFNRKQGEAFWVRASYHF